MTHVLVNFALKNHSVSYTGVRLENWPDWSQLGHIFDVSKLFNVHFGSHLGTLWHNTDISVLLTRDKNNWVSVKLELDYTKQCSGLALLNTKQC